MCVTILGMVLLCENWPVIVRMEHIAQSSSGFTNEEMLLEWSFVAKKKNSIFRIFVLVY